VFQHQGEALEAGDLEAILEDYSEDSILIFQGSVYRGLSGARQVFTQLMADLPEADWSVTDVFADNVLYLQWSAVAKAVGRQVGDGVDTFVFQDGKVRVQTTHYTVHASS
jgi:hypothetical protein